MFTTPGRGGLRRQWNGAFAVLLTVLILATSGTTIAFRQVAAHYKDAATRLDYAISIAADLTHRITQHEAEAHTLWNGGKIDKAGYLRQQVQIIAVFRDAHGRVVSPEQRALIDRASRSWHSVLASRGLWSSTARPNPRVTLDMQQQFGSDSDTVVTTLSQFTQLAIADGASDLMTADTFQMLAFGLLAAMMILVIGVVLYHARRMTHDVLRPLETLQEATQKLSQGDLDHRVEVPARCQKTEVGQLASAFNAMAAVLAENHQSLTLLASRDPLTGLANRLEFQVRLDRRIASNHRRTDDGDIVSVLFIDVDDFKDVNDSLGHAAGDALLAEVANRLSSCLRGRDLVARLGGDEFAILLTDRLADGSSAHGVAQRVIAAFDAPFAIADTEIRVTVSIGVSIASPECDDPEDLLAQADYAMYTSKREGKGRHTVFDDVS